MPEDEKQLYDALLGKFYFTMGVYQDYWNKITRTSIVELIQKRGLHIDSKEGENDNILRRYETEVRTPRREKFELTLRDENNSTSKLIYYFPESPTANGRVFLSEPENKRITEFIQFQEIDKNTPVINGVDGAGNPRYYYTRNFGTKIKTLAASGNGTIVNELNVVNVSKEIKYPIASVGESFSLIRFYDYTSSEDVDFDKLVVQKKYTKPGVSGTKRVSVVDLIIKGLKKEERKPISEGPYYFTDTKEIYEIPDYGKGEKVPRKLEYIKNIVDANEDLVRSFINKLPKEEVVSTQKISSSTAERRGTPLIQREVTESLEEKPESPFVEIGEQFIRNAQPARPIWPMPEIENKFFMALVNKMKEYFRFMPHIWGRNSEIVGELITKILKKEGLHFRMGEIISKSIEDCNISKEGFELIDQEGKSYKITAGSADNLITLVGEDKIINIKSMYYPDEKAKSEFDADCKVEGFEITTIGIKGGGVYKNKNDIRYSRPFGDTRQRNKFFPKPVEMEYYSEDILSSLGVNSKDVMAQAFSKIKSSDPFEDLHVFGTAYADIEAIPLKLDRQEYVSGLNGCTSDDKEFCALYIEQNLEANYLEIEEFLNQHRIQAR